MVETKSLFECVRDGMKFLEERRYDLALGEFERRDTAETYLIPYGIATALFRRGTDNNDLTLDSICGVTTLYEQAISMGPEEPSPYLMAGHAYIKQASLFHAEFQQQRDVRFLPYILGALDKAERYLIKAGEFNNYFKREADALLSLLAEKRAEAKKLLD